VQLCTYVSPLIATYYLLKAKMKLKVIFMVQGAILIVFGLWGLFYGESALSGWG
jgi:hypothetical protein